MNNAAYIKAAYGRSAQNAKNTKEALLEQAHREYQVGDYINAEIHCKQVRLIWKFHFFFRGKNCLGKSLFYRQNWVPISNFDGKTDFFQVNFSRKKNAPQKHVSRIFFESR